MLIDKFRSINNLPEDFTINNLNEVNKIFNELNEPFKLSIKKIKENL